MSPLLSAFLIGCVSALIPTTFDDISTVSNVAIGWKKLFFCNQGNNIQHTYTNGQTWEQLEPYTEHAIAAQILPRDSKPSDFNFDSPTNDLALMTNICSNPIFSMNNQQELSWVVDLTTLDAIDYAHLNDWLGTDTAKARLPQNSGFCNACNVAETQFQHRSLSNIVYHACCTHHGIHLTSTQCEWDYNDQLTNNQGMSFWIGFDINKQKCCNVQNNILQYSQCTDLLTCPDGSIQIGELNADIPGCGIEGCSVRYNDNYATIEDCQNGCIANDNCLSYSWAPKNGDRNHRESTVCTLYGSDAPTSTWSPVQIMCKINKVTMNPTIMPTTIPTDMPTNILTLGSLTISHNMTATPQISGVTFINTNSDSVYNHVVHHHYYMHDNAMAYIIGGLLSALVFLLLCICCVSVWCIKRRNLNNNMKELDDDESKDEGIKRTISNYNHTLELTESVFNTIQIAADEGEETSPTKSNEMLLNNNEKQKFKLIAIDSEDESENGDLDKMYELPIGQKQYETKKYCENKKQQSIDSDVYDGDNTNLLLHKETMDNVVPM